MKIIYAPPLVEITDWEKENDIEITVTELTARDSDKKYFVDIKEAVIQLSTTSNYSESSYAVGSSIDEALQIFCDEISKKYVVFKDCDSRLIRSVSVPELQHTKLFNK